MPAVLVTGATGFVGRVVCARLLSEGWHVRGAIRTRNDSVRLIRGVEPIDIGSIGPQTSWDQALYGVKAVVHLAARAHVMSDDARDPLAAYREINVAGTRRLADASAARGIGRFVFLSSVKVNGEGAAEPYTASGVPRPEDPYGISKWEAEQALWQIAALSPLSPVVIRSPLVYGPGVKANFLKLMRAVDRGFPFPLASVRNQRSLIFVGNLADAVTVCLCHPAAAGRTYLVSDCECVSTAGLIGRIARALGRRARVFPFPPSLLWRLARGLGRSSEVKRILGNLVVDSTAIHSELSWRAPYSMDRGLEETAIWFREMHKPVGES